MKLFGLLLCLPALVAPSLLEAQSMDTGATAVTATVLVGGIPDPSNPSLATTSASMTDLNGLQSTSGSMPVRLMPGVTYDLSVEGDFVDAFNVTIQPPAGYVVEIDYQQNSSESFEGNPGGTSSGYVQFQVLPTDDLKVLSPGTCTPLQANKIFWEVGLGALPNGLSAGRLAVISDGSGSWSNLVQTSSIVYMATSSNVAFRTFSDGHVQAAAYQCIADVVPDSSGTFYTMSFYNLSQGIPSGALYTFSGSPYMTYKVEQVDGGKHLKITSTSTGGAGTKTTVAEIEEDSSGNWTVIGWHDVSSGIVSETTATLTTGTTDGSTGNPTYSYAIALTDGVSTVRSGQKVYETFPWGDELLSDTRNADGGTPLVTTYEYYADTAAPGNYGQVKSVTYSSGAWEAWDYYDDPAVPGLIHHHYQPWGDSPASVSLSPSSGTVTTFTYASDGSGFYKPRITEQATAENGTTIGDWTAGSVSSSGGTDVTMNGEPVVTTTRQDSYASSSGSTLASIYKFYREDASWFYATLPVSQARPDGTMDAFAYEGGTWTAGSASFSPTSAPGSFETATRTTVIHGCSSSASGGYALTSVGGGEAIDTIYVVAGKSTADVTICDETATVVRKETWLWTGGGWTTIAYVNFGTDLACRLVSRSDSTGLTYSATWQGDFKATEIDGEGIVTTYTNDDAWRVLQSSRTAAFGGGALVTRFTYDAADRMVTKTVGYGQSRPIKTTWTYDTAGRLSSETDPGGVVTGYAYPNNGRDLTTTVHGTATRTDAYYLDDRKKSVTGSAVVPAYFSYDVQSGGVLHTLVNLGSSSSARVQETWTDMLGRTVGTSRPGFNGGSAYVESVTYSSTTGQRTRLSRKDGGGTPLFADVLYQYDAMGLPSASGLDVDGNGSLDAGGGDRITLTNADYEQIGGSWWRVSTTQTYPVAGSSNVLTTGIVRDQVTGLATGVVANRQTVDASGNVTDSVTSIDTGAHTTTVSTTTAGTTGTQIVVTTAGLAIQTTGFDGLTATTSYDSLWRAHQRTDARGNAVTYAYFDDTTSSTTPWLGTVSDGSNTTVASYGYDGAGRVAALTDADGHTVYTAYDDRDHITQQWGDGTNPVSYSYDVYGARETMSTYRGGSGWTTSAWPSGGTGDADTTTWTYDPGSGLLASKVDAALHGVSYTYNARGQTATRTWARGVVATYAYSSVTGELTGVSYSDGTPSVSYAYTRSGQLDTAADGTGARSFVYDAGDPLLLAAVDLPAYYGSRILTEQRNSDGLLPGRPTGVQLGTSSAPAADLSQTYYYNNQGRFDHLSASTAGASAVTFDYAYLANSTLVSGIAVSGSSFAVNRSYEAHRDLLASIQTAWGAVSGSNPALAQFDYTYDARWQRLSAQQEGAAFADYYSPGTSYSSVYTYYAYDSQGQLRTSDMYRGTAPSVGNSPSAGDELPGRRFEYRYDNAGNRTKSGPADPAGPSGSADDNYTANNLNQYSARENNTVRIVGNANPSDSMTAGGATINQVDRNFGGTLVPSNGTAPVAGSVAVTADLISAGVTKSITRNYTVAKQSEALGYDVDGNLTSDGMWDYTYDAENRLSQMETSTAAQAVGIAHQILQFSYDYLGRRVEKKVYANSTGGTPTLDHRYIYDGWNLVAETDGSGTLLRTYVWGLDLSGSLTASGGVGALLELTNVSGSSTSNYYASMDGAGNVAGLVKASDGSLAAVYEYSGYGEPMRAEVFDAAVGDNPFRFSSRYTDLESGLVYYGSRYYSVTLGRFINRDPIEEAGGVNLYGFVGNNPVNGWDVLGNDPSSTVFVPPGLSPGGYWVIPLPADYDGSLGAGTVYTDSNGRKYLFVKTSDADEPADYASIFDWSDTQGNQAFGFADSQPNPELVALSQLMSAQANVRQKTLSDQSRQIRSQVDGKKAMELAGHSSAPNKVATSPLEFALSNPGLTAQVMWQIASKDRVAQLELNLIGGRLIGAAAGVFGEAFSWAKGLFGAAETGPLARTMGTVNGIASKAGVDLEGLNVQIINDPELEGRGLYGWTDGEQLHLYPDAFENEEQLVRTLGHERTHVFQVDTFGPVNDSAQLQMNEAGAQAAEEAYWQYYLMNK